MTKIPVKQELQQIAFNHSSDIDFKDLMNLYKKYTDEPSSFLVTDATVPSDNVLRFGKNLLKRMLKLIMKIIDDKIKDENISIAIWKNC